MAKRKNIFFGTFLKFFDKFLTSIKLEWGGGKALRALPLRFFFAASLLTQPRLGPCTYGENVKNMKICKYFHYGKKV